MEVLVSFFILVVGLTGSLSVIIATGKANRSHQNRLIAVNLGQEAMEAIRGIRETNWLLYSSNLRECWNFWEDTNGDGMVDTDDDPCSPVNGQNNNPLPGNDRFLIDIDPDTFQWTLLPDGFFLSADSKDYSQGFALYQQTINGREFYTHARFHLTDIPSLFSREVEMYYLDNPNFVDNGDGTFSGGEFPTNPSQDNRILVVVRVSWTERGAVRDVVLSTILTDFFARTEWDS